MQSQQLAAPGPDQGVVVIFPAEGTLTVQRNFTQRVGWALMTFVLLAYAVTWVVLSPLALQDFPTHLARAVVMDDLIFHGAARFGEVYQYHFLLIPYVLGDLLLAAAVEVFGPDRAGVLWACMTFLSFPAAVFVFLRLTGLVADRRALLLVLCLYLASDRFFLMGYMSFRMAVAMTLVILGLAEKFRRQRSIRTFITYAALVALGYLLHLSTILFVTCAIGSIAALRLLRRSTTAPTEALLLLPLASALLWNALVADAYRVPADVVENPYFWGTPVAKLARLGSELVRYHRGLDWLLGLMAIGSVLLASRPVRKDWYRQSTTLEMFALAATFLALYFVMPLSYSDAWDVDARALPLFTFFLFLGCLSVRRAEPRASGVSMGCALGLAALLAVGNLVILAHDLSERGGWLARYRTVISAIPLYARVFPVFTEPVGILTPLLHANSFVTIDRGGLIPYEFTGDNGSTVRYFRFRVRPYDPPETWYSATPPLNIDWKRVACGYEYLLVTEPFDARRVPLPVHTVSVNSSAALLAIDGGACAALTHPTAAAGSAG